MIIEEESVWLSVVEIAENALPFILSHKFARRGLAHLSAQSAVAVLGQPPNFGGPVFPRVGMRWGRSGSRKGGSAGKFFLSCELFRVNRVAEPPTGWPSCRDTRLKNR